ncbi:hypothetical protein CSKR_200610 [Clonorchis sinensis]|uniref:Uncharacterized protein n=1 Tax=Clonorchis sinensis TaxID=79923 RepID=A0A8T1MG52_CLOSI|nr:hypothetical protein CSKR_200610 [Clonorchis sinensis]
MVPLPAALRGDIHFKLVCIASLWQSDKQTEIYTPVNPVGGKSSHIRFDFSTLSFSPFPCDGLQWPSSHVFFSNFPPFRGSIMLLYPQDFSGLHWIILPAVAVTYDRRSTTINCNACGPASLCVNLPYFFSFDPFLLPPNLSPSTCLSIRAFTVQTHPLWAASGLL